MTIYISVAITFAIVFGILFVLFQKMKKGTEQTTVSMLFAMIIASGAICLIFVLPAVILFLTFWGISYALPNLIDINSYKSLFSLSFLAIGIAFIVEIFFSGIFSGIIRYFNLHLIVSIILKILIYSTLLYVLSSKLLLNVTITFLAALIVSTFIILLERSIEDIYAKRRGKNSNINTNEHM
ncbi:hypothetical protein [Priestia megaterium]|uniref:Uncharacterized protein n=1 Tax=Priestia megaterium TaxID=1404 RepID=A0A6M6E084_PRIMG|nr:hypothetical protein [Priestia megaterium]QJX80260.1 hypothetical protein FDZ14_29630 [Priestia megaterium]